MKYEHTHLLNSYLKETPRAQLSAYYLILAKDPFEQQTSVDSLLQFYCPTKGEQELGLHILEASQLQEKQLKTHLSSPSLFTNLISIIWIQQIDKLKRPLQEILEHFLATTPSTPLLILSGPSLSKTSSLYKNALEKGLLIEVAEKKPWEKEKQCVEWVAKQATAERKMMAYPVCQFFVHQMGVDQTLLAQELNKLFCYCVEKKEITLQDVQSICTRLSLESIWQLGEALFKRDALTALRIGQALIKEEEQALLPLLRQIRSQFQTEYQICLLLAQGKPTQEITQEFPYMKGKILEHHLQLAQNYGLAACKKGLLALDKTESRAKNSGIAENLLFEQLILQLTLQS